jgi:hypothetical protein
MAYTIKRSDGSVLVTIPDQSKESLSTSLVLVGRGAVNYGTDFAENFVHLMENFANVVAPNKPLTGQLWYDLTTAKLKLWTGTEWLLAQGKTSSGNLPGQIVVRDDNGDFSAHIITADLVGNASTSSKWKTPRNLTLLGDASGSVAMDGSTDVVLNAHVNRADSANRATLADRFTTSQTINRGRLDVRSHRAVRGRREPRFELADAPQRCWRRRGQQLLWLASRQRSLC